LLVSSAIYVIWFQSVKRAAVRKVAQMPPTPPRDWSSKFFSAHRLQTDPLADALVADIMSKEELPAVNHLFALMADDTDHLAKDAPAELSAYFEQTRVLPEWADRDLIRLGQQIYIRHGVWVSLLLSYKSLPECYACAKGVEVLYRTARLNEHHGSFDAFYRRIAETAQFVLATMSPHGLSARGGGVLAAQKVRLIHAIIRYYLRQQGWEVEKYGEPINQEDMVGTLMAFSALVLEGLEVVGIQLDHVEKEAYTHCWRVIGHIVGLHEELIPANNDEALALGHAVLNDQMGTSESGQVLTRALTEFLKDASAGFLTEEANDHMLRLMMGGKISDLLGVPQAGEVSIAKLKKKLQRIASVMNFFEKSIVFSLPWRICNQLLLKLMIRYMSKSRRINFYLPQSLTKDWGKRERATVNS
ncbi:MAG: oxygenase MpaB family protein, partial [Bacteroidota bacterium]